MNDHLTEDDWGKVCIVCSKSVEQGGGMCHLNVDNRMIALCCPLCVETYNRDSRRYLLKYDLRANKS